MIYKFVTDECDCCGRTTECATQQDDMDVPIDYICEGCSLAVDVEASGEPVRIGYYYNESIRRGSSIDEPTTHLQAWDQRNYHEDMRLRRDIVVIDIKEES